MARVLSATLTAAQQAVSATPYIRIYVNSTDYWTRLLQLEHHEEAYREYAFIILRNDDLHFNATDLIGKELLIGYGHTTGSNEYVGDGTSEPGVATLWVKSQHLISFEGKLACQLYCEGMWMYMREQRVMLVTAKNATTPYYDVEYPTDTTPYGIIEDVIEGHGTDGMGWTLSPLQSIETPPGTQEYSADDSIIDTFTPTFDLNENPYENAAAVLYRLIWMTKCFLRPKASKTFEVVYPQSTDDVAHLYYSNLAPFFLEYTEKDNIMVPNSISVFANREANWENIITGTAADTTESDKYVVVLQPFLAAMITSQGDADNRAAAILSKIEAEQLSGRLIIPHDHSVELFDRVMVLDVRGS